jgi:hypothetical protein
MQAEREIKERVPTGKVVAIIRRNWRQYCGVIQLGNYKAVCKFYLK